jgi:hypothetical protein
LLLRTFPTHVADDIVEILYNLVYQNVDMPQVKRKRLNRREKGIISNIVNRAKNKSARRQLIYKQTGGFLGAILPIVASVVGGLLSRHA